MCSVMRCADVWRGVKFCPAFHTNLNKKVRTCITYSTSTWYRTEHLEYWTTRVLLLKW